MSTNLELCQAVARDSGTISGVAPTTVAGQTGRLLKIVGWVQEAWNIIQNLHPDWLWMQREFSGTITTASDRYSASDLSISSFEEWVLPDEHGRNKLTVYPVADGVGQEHEINYIEFEEWRRRYARGTQVAAPPVHYSVDFQNKLCFGPIPSANHIVKGLYRKANQVFSANGDIPEMPARFHDMIKHGALLLLSEFDEAAFPVAAERRKYASFMTALEQSQLFRGKRIITAKPLA